MLTLTKLPMRLILLLLLLALLLPWRGSPPSEAAVSNSQAVGTIKIVGLGGEAQLRTRIRSFALEGENTGSLAGGGGGAAGTFTSNAPAVVLDAVSKSPLLFDAVTSGTHLERVTVVLWRPGTRIRQQLWVFDGALLKSLAETQSGPNSHTPRLNVTWTWERVTWQTFKTDGTTLHSRACYDAVTKSPC